MEEALRSLVAEEKKLLRFLESLKVQQEKSKLRQLSHTLKDGDKEDRELDNILSRVHNARSELSIRIQITHVGLTGNQKEGFQVSNDVLMRVGGANAKTLGEGGRHSEIRNVKIGNKAKIGLGDVSKLAAADFFKAWGGGK